jgi:hypothetical protein
MHTCSAERLVYGQVKAIMICRPYVWILVLFVEHDNVAFMLPTLVGFLALLQARRHPCMHACFIPGEEKKRKQTLCNSFTGVGGVEWLDSGGKQKILLEKKQEGLTDYSDERGRSKSNSDGNSKKVVTEEGRRPHVAADGSEASEPRPSTSARPPGDEDDEGEDTMSEREIIKKNPSTAGPALLLLVPFACE